MVFINMVRLVLFMFYLKDTSVGRLPDNDSGHLHLPVLRQIRTAKARTVLRHPDNRDGDNLRLRIRRHESGRGRSIQGDVFHLVRGLRFQGDATSRRDCGSGDNAAQFVSAFGPRQVPRHRQAETGKGEGGNFLLLYRKQFRPVLQFRHKCVRCGCICQGAVWYFQR